MKNGFIIICLFLVSVQDAFAQPPLSKRMQKQKDAFEAQIEREEKYEALVVAADRAFKEKDYLLARMTYEEAKDYNEEEVSWLTSKVNDLDILMAKNAAREVDSILVALRPKRAAKLTEDEPDIAFEERELERPLPLPEPREETEEKDTLAPSTPVKPAVPDQPERQEEEEEEIVEVSKPQPVEIRSIQPKQPEQPKPARDKVKVKEDFSAFEDGRTEQIFELDNHTVLRIVVKEGIDVMVFKRVKHNWGGEFYFFDDVATTKRYWTDQVTEYRAKYPGTGN